MSPFDLDVLTERRFFELNLSSVHVSSGERLDPEHCCICGGQRICEICAIIVKCKLDKKTTPCPGLQ